MKRKTLGESTGSVADGVKTKRPPPLTFRPKASDDALHVACKAMVMKLSPEERSELVQRLKKFDKNLQVYSLCSGSEIQWLSSSWFAANRTRAHAQFSKASRLRRGGSPRGRHNLGIRSIHRVDKLHYCCSFGCSANHSETLPYIRTAVSERSVSLLGQVSCVIHLASSLTGLCGSNVFRASFVSNGSCVRFSSACGSTTLSMMPAIEFTLTSLFLNLSSTFAGLI
jgi:hypothetical protein